ncbi:hypothetical protein [Tropicimonas aquimaris]|uniref:DUF3618 domain-containing protein n=1 Tax=Tropicimonas aquimaris TaxID=914152 RepID=A0ABW3IXA0_9RHOB
MADVTEKTVTEQVKHHAQTVADDTREKVEARIKGEAEAARDSVADQMHRHASAADAAAAEFDPNSMQAQAIEQVAARIDDLASQIRNTDIDRLAHSLSDAARRNPLLFVAGATLAGFAATRFLKARDPEPRYAHPSDDPWARDTVPPNSAPTIVGGNHVSADPTSRGAV